MGSDWIRRVWVIGVVFIFTTWGVASSEIYKYVDENGVIYYTDTPKGKGTEVVHSSPSSEPTYEDPSDYHSIVKNTAGKYNLDPSLIHAVIKTESNYNKYAVSRKGAMGLMQLMPSTAQDLGVENPFHPIQNIDGGARYLRQLLEKFNWNLTLALAAYNAGPETVKKYGNVPPIKETRDYVRKVLSLYGVPIDYLGQSPSGSKTQRAKKNPPARIYRVVLEDGTILFTNTKPLSSGSY